MPTIASKSYKAGEVIFECKPIFHLIELEFKTLHCDYCLKKKSSLQKCLQKCVKCHQMYYCDKECQQNDWIFHKNECKVYRHPNFDMSSALVFVRSILRLHLRLKADPEFGDKRFKLYDGSEVCLNEMDVNIKKLKESPKEMTYFATLCNLFRGYGLFFSREELLKSYGLINAFKFSPLHYYTDNPLELSFDAFNTPIASGVYVHKLDISHSCLPNSGILKNGIFSLQFPFNLIVCQTNRFFIEIYCSETYWFRSGDNHSNC